MSAASAEPSLAEEHLKEYKKASAVRVGDIIMIRGHACKVIAIQVSKTGKHGHAKVRIEFEGGSDALVFRADDPIEFAPPAPLG